MAKHPLTFNATFQTPVSEGRYSIDGQWYSAEDFCRIAHQLVPELLRPRPELGPDATAIDTSEAAQVLREHGHVVGNTHGPQMPTLRGNIWWVDGEGAYLQRCPQCGHENYTMAVPSGQCCRCRYDANQYPACQYPRPASAY